MDFHGEVTQILLKDDATDETTVVYTVPADKEFHLVSSKLGTDGGAAGIVSASIRNDSDVVQMDIGQIKIGATTENALSCPFMPAWSPILIEGWNIVVVSDTASLKGTLNLFGVEVDA